ncbi:MAG: hypothetical protein Q9167_006953 [Letrouitia subvulpina]
MALSDQLELSARSEDEREREQSANLQIKDNKNREKEDTNDLQDIATGFSLKLQELLNYFLRFVSTANNETLAACLVALCAIIYVVLGRVGLVLIGVVMGVIFHATWEENGQKHMDDEFKVRDIRRRRETGLRIAERVLDWRESKNAKVDLSAEDSKIRSPSQGSLNYSSFRPATEAALTNLTDAVIRDYVKYNSPAKVLKVSDEAH